MLLRSATAGAARKNRAAAAETRSTSSVAMRLAVPARARRSCESDVSVYVASHDADTELGRVTAACKVRNITLHIGRSHALSHARGTVAHRVGPASTRTCDYESRFFRRCSCRAALTLLRRRHQAHLDGAANRCGTEAFAATVLVAAAVAGIDGRLCVLGTA